MLRGVVVAVLLSMVVALLAGPAVGHAPTARSVLGAVAMGASEPLEPLLPSEVPPPPCGATFAVCGISVTPPSIDANGIATSGVVLVSAWVGGNNASDTFAWSGVPWKFSLCTGPQTTWIFTCEIDVPGIYVFNLTATAPGGAVAWGQTVVYVNPPPTVGLAFIQTSTSLVVGDALTAVATVTNGSPPFYYTFQASPGCGASTGATVGTQSRVGEFTCILATSGRETISVTVTDSPGYQTLAPPTSTDQKSLDVAPASSQPSSVPPSQSVNLLGAIAAGLVVGLAIGAVATWAFVKRKS